MNTIKEQEIYKNIDLWESDELGYSKETARISNFSVEDLQKSIQLQSISLRIQKDVLEDLKYIAKSYGIGYQPLMKQILKRFVDAEKQLLLREEVEFKKEFNKKRIYG
ncbi:CopG family antitoxin [Pasteurella multocida]|uniref:CopG family antitoxin n=1 Tax=Pasteurella multocida TaxID=747 RepID=UPI0022610395|nr:CopG family antitoxin [Pasteurella multocida]UZV74208.1 CopG family antitoxin [Pasteurella multocida]WAJ42263.1 CopG family antitoxin [Pasteurella multocida]